MKMSYIVLWTRGQAVLEQREFYSPKLAAIHFHKASLKAGIKSPGPPEGLDRGRNLMNAGGTTTIYAFALPQ
jgi:hypothetical protein